MLLVCHNKDNIVQHRTHNNILTIQLWDCYNVDVEILMLRSWCWYVSSILIEKYWPISPRNDIPTIQLWDCSNVDIGMSVLWSRLEVSTSISILIEKCWPILAIQWHTNNTTWRLLQCRCWDLDIELLCQQVFSLRSIIRLRILTWAMPKLELLRGGALIRELRSERSSRIMSPELPGDRRVSG